MSRTFGVGPCVLAGFKYSSGDCIVYLDSDLQDPISLISGLLKLWEEKKPDIVLAKRVDRSSDTKAKKN